jgi:YVTN family beta-propeller protein
MFYYQIISMKRMLALVCLAFIVSARPVNAAGPALQRIGDFPLPGRTTRWDYQALDPASGKLYIAHLGDSEVVVLDTKTKRVVARIPDIADVHGTLAIPGLGRVYASATGKNEIVAIDTATDRIVARIPTGAYPDGLAYAPKAGKLFVSDKTGNSVTVIDAQTNRRIATIPLGGEIGNSQYDPGSGHIFANVQGLKKLAEIDPDTNRVVRLIPLPGAEGNHGLFIEPALRLAFIACEDNDRLLVLNLDTDKERFNFKVGKAPDVLAYDAGLGLLYVAGEAGVVSVFHVSAAGMSKKTEGLVGPNAHTVAVDPLTHEAYFPLRNAGGHPVMRVMKP